MDGAASIQAEELVTRTFFQKLARRDIFDGDFDVFQMNAEGLGKRGQDLFHRAVELPAVQPVGTEVDVRLQLLCSREGPVGIFEPAPDNEDDPEGVVRRRVIGV